jgi:hypothetical protein
MVMKVKNPVPGSLEAWLVEIAAAYQDASEAIPFGPAAGEPFGEAELFHVAPAVALKLRGLPRSSRKLARLGRPKPRWPATSPPEMAIRKSSRTRTFPLRSAIWRSHHGLGLVGEAQTEEVMDYVERNRRSLARLITRGAKPNELRLFAAHSRGKRRC